MSCSDDNSCPPEILSIDLCRDGNSAPIQLELVYIKPGTFIMGGESTIDNRFQCVEVPKHSVQLTHGFYLGKYPVTQAQYQAVMGSNPSKSTKGPDCPVDNIGEEDALDFCNILVERIGRDFRLPTEAEWEYACRAGEGDKKWFFGNDSSNLGDYAWFKHNSGGKSHPVGQKKPNSFGLYDIYGNVYERVSDKYAKDYYANSPFVNPVGPIQGKKSAFEYKVHVPWTGDYTIIAEVVTANENQRLNVSVNGNELSAVVMELPFTNGCWRDCCPVEVVLKEGENTLRFWRDEPPQYGVAIKKFLIKKANCNKSSDLTGSGDKV